MCTSSWCRPVFEGLENRQYAAAHTAVAASADSVPLAGVRVSLDSDLALHVDTTSGDESIRIRGTVNGYTQIDVTSDQILPSAHTTVTPAARQVAAAGERLFNVDRGQEIVERDGNTLTITRRYTVPTSTYVNIGVDGGDGHDVLRLSNLPTNPVIHSVEHVLLTQTAAPAGTTPADTVTTGHYGPGTGWAKEVARQKIRADNSDAPIAFIGDSHAAYYLTYGRNDWLKTFSSALNLGLPGDSTRQLLTRIQQGLFDKYKPKKLIVMIGANNFNDPSTGGTDEQIYRGVIGVITELRNRLPQTKLVLIGVLPQREAGVNDRVLRLNNRVARNAAAGGGFSYMNPFEQYVGAPVNDTLIRIDDHMTPAGYDLFNDLLSAFLKSV